MVSFVIIRSAARVRVYVSRAPLRAVVSDGGLACHSRLFH